MISLSQLPFYGTILAASFLGSWHCAGMCSPIACLMRQESQLWTYHLGRAVGYTSLGALAGSLGGLFVRSEVEAFRWIAQLLLTGIVFFYGLTMFSPRIFTTKRSVNHRFLKLTGRIMAKAQSLGGFTVGICTSLLPCGWLYSFVATAALTRSPLGGALVTFTFYLGTVPVLLAIPQLIRPGLNQRLPWAKVAGALLIIASLYSLAMFAFSTSHK
ncbi:MAG TPA: sulfite exporter TauE/SafE family protein [Pseudobdellovibrionaceae bacterium]|nr:sulfite exporter TauE/SafE family protein [Pseudobdellovibrionaceae bacterium]